MKCCTKIKCLDTIGGCGVWQTGLIANSTGDYDFIYTYGKVQHRIAVSLTISEPLQVVSDNLPRGMIIFYLQDEDGLRYVDDDGNDCFSMDVVISV